MDAQNRYDSPDRRRQPMLWRMRSPRPLCKPSPPSSGPSQCGSGSVSRCAARPVGRISTGPSYRRVATGMLSLIGAWMPDGSTSAKDGRGADGRGLSRYGQAVLRGIESRQSAFFGFSTGPRQPAFYWTSIVFYALAVAVSFLIFVPIPTKVNVAYDTARELARAAAPIIPAKLYYDYAAGHQDAINDALKILDGRFGIATRFRTLIVAIAVLIVSASLSVALGTEHAPSPTHVIVDRSQ